MANLRTARATTRASIVTRRMAAVGADLVAVLGFVALGRTSHHEGGAVAGFVTTAWPFLTGCLAGSALLLAGRRPDVRSLRAGAVVVATTVVVGMTLRRAVTGGGTPVSFLVVASTFLALFLLGWRASVRVLDLRRARS